MRDAPHSTPPSNPSRPATKGLDEYSEVLGMTPREHEARMRKWYVLLAIALFFAVFGEGILMLTAKAKERRDAAASAAARAGAGATSGTGASGVAAPR